MKKLLVSIILAGSLLMANTSFAAHAQPTSNGNCLNMKFINLKYPMQKLWVEHAWWARSLIVSTLSNLPDREMVLQRLLHNQVDLGNIIKPYYGEAAGNRFTALLKEHILIAAKLVDTAQKGDQENVKRIDTVWHQNADKIVNFLASLNPYWSKKALTDMFYYHLKLTTEEVVDRLQMDWAGDIKTADASETHLIKMGDFLTDGIAKQYPEKFK